MSSLGIRRRKRLVFTAGFLIIISLIAIGQLYLAGTNTQSQSADKNRLQPSGEGLPFDGSHYRDFDDYIEQTRARLERHKLYLDPDRKDVELAAAMPFERVPADLCMLASSDRPRRGILLLHGLSDMPLAMWDMADAFASRCFLVRTMLLPGHGTRAGDLLNVTRSDWMEAVRFGLEMLNKNVDEVFIGGFSLGGLLSVHALLTDTTVNGAFVFSPALALEQTWLIRHTVWLRYILDWLDREPPDDYARYEAFPVNATAETFLLTKELAELLKRQDVAVPVFMVQSADDPVVDVVVNRSYFENSFTHPGSRLIVYRRDPQEGSDAIDERISYLNSFLPDQRVSGFSHLSVHNSPTNAHYGVEGDYRSCGQSTGESADAVARCLAAPNPWRGEVFGASQTVIPGGEPVARLTYNPRFNELLDQIDDFITTNSF